MSPKQYRNKTYKTEIPRELYQAIIRIQADEDLDWMEAAEKAGLLIDSNKEKFKKAVKRNANKLSKSKFMQQLNKARKTIQDKAYNEGLEYARYHEDNFRIPCSTYGKPLKFSSRHDNWIEIQSVLLTAFRNWGHDNCV